MKDAILEILKSYTGEMGNSHWHGSNQGIPEVDYDEIADEILKLITPEK